MNKYTLKSTSSNGEQTFETQETCPAAKLDQVTTQSSASNDAETSTSKRTILEQLRAMALNGRLDELHEQTQSVKHIAGGLAVAGQITIFYAGPNTGKTLITLKLVAEAIANKTIDSDVFHLNLDDASDGLINKTELGERFGFYVLSAVEFPRPNTYFTEMVNKLIAEDSAKEVIFIIDTIKKFVDVMDKGASSDFMTTCRKFTAAGGSIIALAHVNKQKNSQGQGIPAGTSDVLDDCDCAYVINVISDEKVPNGRKRIVEFQQEKARGHTVEKAAYSYVINDDSDYDQLFNSVQIVDGNEADQIRKNIACKAELDKDAPIIDAVTKLLEANDKLKQSDIETSIGASNIGSRREIVSCLKRWQCPANEGGLWRTEKGTKNSNIYSLIK